MKTTMTSILICVAFLSSSVLLAAEVSNVPVADQTSQPSASASIEKNVIWAGVKGGVNLPQLSSSLQTSFSVLVEGAYLFPFWGSRFGLVTAFGYSQPKASGSGLDSRLPGGSYTWEATQRQLTWDLGIILKIWPSAHHFNLGLAAGSRIMFLSTLTNGEAGGEAFGEHDEQATILGIFVAAQADYQIGPGAFFGELAFDSSFQNLKTTGDLALSSLGVLFGYRFIFSF
jgi:hypothetical protein